MRDHNDNCVIVCSIENIDPMGVHTGDSVTVAPQQTLTDRLYQQLRDQAFQVIRAVGVETGGSNVQFAVNPATEEILVIEMNPRVSRSSALASKATGFPIAKIAARLAVGYALEEIDNDITAATPAAFEPTIDYVVVKWPRFAFEKFAGADSELTTHMKSVGEAMAMGRTFQQAFGKAMRSRELDATPRLEGTDEELLTRLEKPSADRYDVLLEVLRAWRLDRRGPRAHRHRPVVPRGVRRARADPQAPVLRRALVQGGRHLRGRVRGEHAVLLLGLGAPAGPRGRPRRPAERGHPRLGPQPHRPGHRVRLLLRARRDDRPRRGRDAVMINCNPETVSTDYDTSDRLYFEPLTLEDVLGVLEVEQPEGVIVQFGGQTPLKLAHGLEQAGVKILGTSVDAIDLAEDRGRFGDLLDRLGYQAPPYATAHSVDEALAKAQDVGFPLLVRPSYVLGGRAMEIVYSDEALADYLARERVGQSGSDRAIYLDRFLENAIEVDVDALCDGEQVWIGGMLQHVEEAGIHSGDSAQVLPPHSLGPEMLEQLREHTEGIARGLNTIGLINVQYAIANGRVFVIEANPRASRTVPFISKAVGVPLAKMACRIMLGEKIADLGLPENPMDSGYVAVKEAVLPFDRFKDADAILGPEMRSTGEVMGIAQDFPTAFAKAQAAAGAALPMGGTVFLTVTDSDKAAVHGIASTLHDLGFRIVATAGTAQAIRAMGVPCDALNKVGEGSPHVVDWIERGDVDLVVNTPTGSGARSDGWEIRRAAVARGIPAITTLSGAFAAARAIGVARQRGAPDVLALQEIHASRASLR
jgi:carbamoyl-phosphate synthase large subunit